jgi:hypothetical protein
MSLTRKLPANCGSWDRSSWLLGDGHGEGPAKGATVRGCDASVFRGQSRSRKDSFERRFKQHGDWAGLAFVLDLTRS